uniref:Gustatory receptor n=1 Tax=Anopheles atroparvus TaxID=41427 RepID=A0A182JBW8_ANOAO
MAWNHTDDEKMRHLLRLTIGPTMRLSQILSVAPYPLSLFQRNYSLASVQVQLVIFVRLLVAIAVAVLTVSSFLVLFFYYPKLLYLPTVPMFIKILYYIGSFLQVLTVGNLLIGCEHRRPQYETYFERALVLVRNTASQGDCQQTVWYRNTIKALLVIYSSVVLMFPFASASVLFDIGTIPYTIVHLVPFTVSALILLQYYCVSVHLSSISRKLNDRLETLAAGTAWGQPETHLKSVYVPHGQDHSFHPVKPGESLFQRIEQLRLLHVQLWEMASVLFDNFSPVIILILVSTFASVNIDLLELYQCAKHATLSPFQLVLKGLYAGIKFFFYFLIAYPNRLNQKEVKNGG